MKTRMIILSIAIFVGSIYGGHWRFYSDSIRARIDTMKSCQPCDWGVEEDSIPILINHWCNCPSCGTTPEDHYFRKLFEVWSNHSIWAYKGDCIADTAVNLGSPFWSDLCDSGNWVHVYDTFSLPIGWESEQCKKAVLCVSSAYHNLVQIRINGNEVFSYHFTQDCPWKCVKGYEWGSSDSAYLFLHDSLNVLETCVRIVHCGDHCGSLTYLLDIFSDDGGFGDSLVNKIPDDGVVVSYEHGDSVFTIELDTTVNPYETEIYVSRIPGYSTLGPSTDIVDFEDETIFPISKNIIGYFPDLTVSCDSGWGMSIDSIEVWSICGDESTTFIFDTSGVGEWDHYTDRCKAKTFNMFANPPNGSDIRLSPFSLVLVKELKLPFIDKPVYLIPAWFKPPRAGIEDSLITGFATPPIKLFSECNECDGGASRVDTFEIDSTDVAASGNDNLRYPSWADTSWGDRVLWVPYPRIHLIYPNPFHTYRDTISYWLSGIYDDPDFGDPNGFDGSTMTFYVKKNDWSPFLLNRMSALCTYVSPGDTSIFTGDILTPSSDLSRNDLITEDLLRMERIDTSGTDWAFRILNQANCNTFIDKVDCYKVEHPESLMSVIANDEFYSINGITGLEFPGDACDTCDWVVDSAGSLIVEFTDIDTTCTLLLSIPAIASFYEGYENTPDSSRMLTVTAYDPNDQEYDTLETVPPRMMSDFAYIYLSQDYNNSG
ncbi:hypothetical protein DRQ36_10990, partial [bacterium]